MQGTGLELLFKVESSHTVRQVTHSARRQYSRIYDNNGRPVLRSSLDPLLRPCNDRVENVITDYLPAEQLKAKQYTNELSRSIRLGRTAMERSIPMIREGAAIVAKVPTALTYHVREVYKGKESNHSKGDEESNPRVTVLAVLGTSRQLSREWTKYVVDSVGRHGQPRRRQTESPRTLLEPQATNEIPAAESSN